MNGELVELRRERDALAAQVEGMRDAIATVEGWIIITEGNCSCHISPPCSNCIEKGNAEYDDEQVKAALALPDLHSDILKRMDAKTVRDFVVAMEKAGAELPLPYGEWYAKELENGK